MFRGINSINIDAKGRMAMPSRYREQLSNKCSGQLVVTIDTNHKCLLLYPLPEWEQIERQIESLSSFDPMSQRVKHLLIGHANDLDLAIDIGVVLWYNDMGTVRYTLSAGSIITVFNLPVMVLPPLSLGCRGGW